MSLNIFFISKDESEDSKHLERKLENEVNLTNSNVFGFEIFRKSLWGNKIMNELGCDTIYSLRECNIYVFGEDMLKLKDELLTILSNIEMIELRTDILRETIEVRVQNALTYIKFAEKYIDYIGITIG